MPHTTLCFTPSGQGAGRDLVRPRLDGSVNYVQAYRRQVAKLCIGMAALGTAAQVVAGASLGSPPGQMLAINGVALLSLVALFTVVRRQVAGAAVPVLLVFTFLNVTLGLIYLNGGYDGSHLYPALWVFSLVGIAGMYGSWLLTLLTAVVGIAVVLAGKLACPDLLFGVGADQSWTRIGAMGVWWVAGLGGAGSCGQRVLHIAQAAMRADEAVHRSQAREHAAEAATERLSAGLVAQRLETLTGLAQSFDSRIQSVVITVARTADHVRAQATELNKAAILTGERAGTAASLSASASADTIAVAQASLQLENSLHHVLKQARDAADAASGMAHQVRRSDGALAAFDVAAEQVARALALIDRVAAQTKLLALNATIEAARAGAAGQGFAVVAAEIKHLAQQTASTTGEISRLMASMRGASAGVGEALSLITHDIDRVTSSALEVEGAVQQQATAIGSISDTAAALHDKARQVNAEVLEVAGSADVTTESAREMVQSANLLGQDADLLQREASSFIARVCAG